MKAFAILQRIWRELGKAVTYLFMFLFALLIQIEKPVRWLTSIFTRKPDQ